MANLHTEYRRKIGACRYLALFCISCIILVPALWPSLSRTWLMLPLLGVVVAWLLALAPVRHHRMARQTAGRHGQDCERL